MAFKDRLKEARQKINMPKDEFAQKIGVSESAIGNYEAGVSFPKTDVLYKIFDTLQTTPNFLFQDFSLKTKEELDIHELEYIKKYRQLDSYGKRAVSDLLNIEYERCKALEKYITIRCSTLSVCAGNGLELDDEHFENIEVLNTPESFKATFAVPVKGRSMEPTYPDGSILLIRKQPSVSVGHVGIFSIDDGQAVVKELSDKALISYNKNYEPIPLKRIELCFGEVLGIAIVKKL